MAACAIEVTVDTQTRDNRVMNHMDPDTKAVHARLEAWGAWARDGEIRAWPVATMLARVIEQGTAGAAQGGRPPVAMPDEIAAVDAAVCTLGDIDKQAVRLYYIKWAPIEVHARKLGMRERQFRNVMRRARWRLAARLNLL
jgi:DNA-directed RNA polymerase specialized sigma24 family protein